ncbi:MAG: hypothetical protein R2733_00240 [Acidimicrobiales bacterium]
MQNAPPRAVVGRTGWMVADQAANSIFSLVAGLLAAQQLDVVGFGVFSTLFAAYLVLRDSLRALVLDPMIIRRAHHGADQRSVVFGLSVALATAAGLAAVVTSMWWTRLDGATAVAFTVAAIALCTVETLRAFAVLDVRPDRAAGLSVLLIVGTVGSFPLVTGGPDSSATYVLIALSLGGLLAAASSARGLSRLRPRVPNTWLAAHRSIGLPLFVDYLASAGVTSFALFVLAGIDIEQAAGLRGAQMIAAPLTLLFVALLQALTAEGARLRATDPEVIERFGRMVVGVMAIAGVVATAMVAVLGGQLVRALGESGAAARPVLVPMVVLSATSGASLAASGVLRSRDESRAAMHARLLASGPFAFGVIVGAILDGARGLAIGGSIANVVTVPLWWRAVVQTRPRQLTLE